MKTLTQFYDDLPMLYLWTLTPDGLQYTLFSERDTFTVPHTASWGVLSQVHPQLPQALHGLLVLNREDTRDDENYQSGTYFRAQVRFLTTPRCVQDERTQHTYPAAYIYNIDWPDPSQLVELECDVYFTEDIPRSAQIAHSTQDTNNTLPAPALVTRVQDKTLYAPPAWLDATYPGWRDRLTIGESLGYEATTLASYVFDTSAAPHTDPTLAALPDSLAHY